MISTPTKLSGSPGRANKPGVLRPPPVLRHGITPGLELLNGRTGSGRALHNERIGDMVGRRERPGSWWHPPAPDRQWTPGNVDRPELAPRIDPEPQATPGPLPPTLVRLFLTGRAGDDGDHRVLLLGLSAALAVWREHLSSTDDAPASRRWGALVHLRHSLRWAVAGDASPFPAGR